MDADLKAKWLKALRSGEYKQCQGVLHDPRENRFCCLGVLCRIAGAEFCSDVIEEDEGECIIHQYAPVLNGRVLGQDEELRESFAKEIGISDQFELIKLNDGHTDAGIRPHSFSEIADYIEANL